MKEESASEERRDIADAFVAERERAAGRRLDPAFRTRLVERLASRPLETLRALRDGVDDAAPLLKALGDSSADLVYTPVTPCRIFDTRLTSAGALVPATPRNFLVAGTGFGPQGGNPSGCGVPLGPATAVVVNLAVVSPTGSGNLRAWAVANPQPPAPLAAVMNFGNVAGLPALANAVVVPICAQAMTGGCTSDLRLQTDVSAAHVVGDVLGYMRSVDLAAEIPIGSDSFGSVTAANGANILRGATQVVMPPRFTDCVVTCSISVTSSSPNVSGQASVMSGALLAGTGSGGFAGSPMFAAPVASAGSSSATQTGPIGLGASLAFEFACLVSASGDFVGDQITGTVGWVCH